MQLTGLVARLELFQPLGQPLETRVAKMAAQPRGDLDHDLLGLLLLTGRVQDRFDHIGVEHQIIEIVVDGPDADMRMDQRDGFLTQYMPEQCPLTGGRLERFVDPWAPRPRPSARVPRGRSAGGWHQSVAPCRRSLR